MTRVVISLQAERDFSDLWHYIDANSDEARATTVLRGIKQKLELLAEQPGMGRLRDDLRDGLRSHPVGQYLIFYFPLDDGIEVVRVIHGRRDIDAMFEEEEV